MRKLAVAFVASSLLTFSNIANCESIVSDSFESGDLSTTSAAGFKWSRSGANPVITASPEAGQWEAKTGAHALMLRYDAGRSWTERKFRWSEPQPEIWMSFWLRVPTNYAHPKVKGASDNQKLFRLWMDGYGQKGDGTTLGMSFRGDGHGGSYFFVKIAGSGDKGSVPFINIPGDRGRWMHLVVHVKSESLPGEKDGLMEVWRKWEGNSDYTKTHDFKDHHIKLSSTKKGFAYGYLMGWANAAYPVDTEFLIDDFELSTSPLFLNSNASKGKHLYRS